MDNDKADNESRKLWLAGGDSLRRVKITANEIKLCEILKKYGSQTMDKHIVKRMGENEQCCNKNARQLMLKGYIKRRRLDKTEGRQNVWCYSLIDLEE